MLFRSLCLVGLSDVCLCLVGLSDMCVSSMLARVTLCSPLPPRVFSTFNWTVPFLSWLAIVTLCVATLAVYFIPLRYIVLAWGEQQRRPWVGSVSES